MALLAMGGFVAACGLFFMGICCCRTVSIGPYHEKNQKIDFNGLKKLFPKVGICFNENHTTSLAHDCGSSIE